MRIKNPKNNLVNILYPPSALVGIYPSKKQNIAPIISFVISFNLKNIIFNPISDKPIPHQEGKSLFSFKITRVLPIPIYS